jgi:hypothetical protein
VGYTYIYIYIYICIYIYAYVYIYMYVYIYIYIGGGAIERVYMLRATRRSFAGISGPQKSALECFLAPSRGLHYSCFAQ